jgi:hypothetical protein
MTYLINTEDYVCDTLATLQTWVIVSRQVLPVEKTFVKVISHS